MAWIEDRVRDVFHLLRADVRDVLPFVRADVLFVKAGFPKGSYATLFFNAHSFAFEHVHTSMSGVRCASIYYLLWFVPLHFYTPFYTLPGGKPMNAVQTGTIAVDFVGRFENMQEDWRTVQQALAISAPLLHENSNTYSIHAAGYTYRDFYTKDTIAIIAKRYKRDIDEFGYTF
jgi:hypothetical protein